LQAVTVFLFICSMPNFKMNKISENDIELYTIEELNRLGFQFLHGPDIVKVLPKLMSGDVRMKELDLLR